MANSWSDSKGLAISEKIRARARIGLVVAADWAARNQIRHHWPVWNANTGRFPYHVHLHTDAHFWSLAWNTSRMAQGLLSAWRILGKKEDLTSIEIAVEYVKSLQYFSPEKPELAGLFIAETPLSDYISMRDSIECAQALVAHYAATKNEISFLRAKRFFDNFAAMMNSGAWPAAAWWRVPRLEPLLHVKNEFPKAPVEWNWNNFVGALPLAQFAGITGEKKYLQCAERLGDLILTHSVRADGAMHSSIPIRIHTSSPDNVLDNDDGLCVSLIALWKHTRKAKYLDAAVANGDWWISRGDKLPDTFTVPSVLVVILADLARATGEKRFTDFIEALADRFFALQIQRDERPLVKGAFRGEDMAEDYRKGSSSADFISLRSTAYGLLALGKLAAGNARQWNPAYSGFGL